MAQPRSTLPEIVLVHNSASEQQARALLLQWFERYSLDKWRYANLIRIEDDVIPHSHPVLTLSPQTRWNDYLADPEQLLAAYMHEQLHWFLLREERDDGARQAMAELRERYPDLPVALPAGCGSAFSNYLHILVNYLEYQGLTELFGVAEAQRVVARIPHYTHIYALVMEERDQLLKLMTRYGLVLDAQPPRVKRFIDIRSPGS